MDVNEEVKFLWKLKKEISGGGRGGGRVGGQGGCGRIIRVFFCENSKKWGVGFGGQGLGRGG